MHLSGAKDEAFSALAERLSRTTVGAPVSETLIGILERLWTPRQAEIASRLPTRPIGVDDLAASVGMSLNDVAVQLKEMTARGYVSEVLVEGRSHYELTPLVFGFFEYTFMRADHESIRIEELAALFESYFREPGVLAELTNADGGTKMMRVFGQEAAMPIDVRSEIMPYERASQVVASSGGGAVGACSCRHQRLHAGTKECDHPVDDMCLSFGPYAEWMVERGFARAASVDELMQVLERAREHGLLHAGDNVQNEIAFLCNCCGCCCVSLRAFKSDGVVGLQPSGFLAGVDAEVCTGCGVCEDACPIGAISLDAASATAGQEVAVVNSGLCLGCGVCVDRCPTDAICFVRRPHSDEPPVDVAEKMRRMAREKGR